MTSTLKPVCARAIAAARPEGPAPLTTAVSGAEEDVEVGGSIVEAKGTAMAVEENSVRATLWPGEEGLWDQHRPIQLICCRN